MDKTHVHPGIHLLLELEAASKWRHLFLKLAIRLEAYFEVCHLKAVGWIYSGAAAHL